MALDIQLRHHTEYFRATLRGTVRLAETQEALRKVATATEQTGSFSILVDVRATTCVLSDADIEALVADLSAHQAALHRKLAFVYRDDRQGEIARSFELRAWTHELRVRVFTEDASAIQWLADAPAKEAC